MKRLPLKSSLEYDSRVDYYAHELAKRYGKPVARAFLKEVKAAEGRLKENCNIGTPEPYILNGEPVVLQELYFQSGPQTYCIIFETTEYYVGLIMFWHGRGSRQSKYLQRIWR